MTGKICFRENPKSPKASENKGFTLPSRSYLPLMSKDFKVTSDPLMRVLRGEMKGLFMFTAALMPQAGLLFCLSLSNLSVSYAPGGSAPISGRVALEAARLMPPRLRKQSDLPRQLALCPKKSFLCPETDKVGQSSNINQTKPATESPADMPPAVSRFPALLQLSSIFLPQTKTLPAFWGKCVQIYGTTTGAVFQQTPVARPSPLAPSPI